MTAFPLIQALKEGLDGYTAPDGTAVPGALDELLLEPAGASRDPAMADAAPWVKPAVCIGRLPRKESGEAQVPFVVIQNIDGEIGSDGLERVGIVFRCAAYAQDAAEAVRDLHAIMSAVCRFCAGCSNYALKDRFLLDTQEGRYFTWTCPDGQEPPYQEGYIMTRWRFPAGI